MREEDNIMNLLNDDLNNSQISYAYLGTTVKEKLTQTYTIIKRLGKGTFG